MSRSEQPPARRRCGATAAVSAGSGAPSAPKLSDGEFRRFAELMRTKSGVAVRSTKKAMVVSRLMSVLRALEMTSFAEYLVYLEENWESREVAERFINAITTNRTEFFRDANQFQLLRDHLTQMIRGSSLEGGRRLRIWSAACSTGEEPYTIAMVVQELVRAESSTQVSILASDIDTDALRKASAGRYPVASLDLVPVRLRRSCFVPCEKDGGGSGQHWRVTPSLRKMILFRRVNLISNAFRFREPVDIVFCRNMLIYFDKHGQGLIMNKIHEIMPPGGLLFVGHAESMVVPRDLFEIVAPNTHRRL